MSARGTEHSKNHYTTDKIQYTYRLNTNSTWHRKFQNTDANKHAQSIKVTLQNIT